MPSPPFFATVLEPSPCRTLRSRWFCSARCPDAGDECLIERAIVGPFCKHLVDGRVVDHGGPVACLGYRQALPLHTRVEYPQDQIEDAVIAQFAFRPAPGHREVREDKCDELRLGELNRDRRCGGAFWHLAHPDMVS